MSRDPLDPLSLASVQRLQLSTDAASLIKAPPNGLMVVDAHLYVQAINPVICAFFGIDQGAAAFAHRLDDLPLPPELRRFVERWHAGGQFTESLVFELASGGESRLFECRVFEVSIEPHGVMLLTVCDVTQERAASDELRRFRAAFDPKSGSSTALIAR